MLISSDRKLFAHINIVVTLALTIATMRPMCSAQASPP